MGDYKMPSLGADMEVGTVVKWLVAPGDDVRRGDVVAEIETEKSTIDAEIFEDGVVESLLVREGEEVPVGTPLAVIAARKPSRARREVPLPPAPVPMPVVHPPRARAPRAVARVGREPPSPGNLPGRGSTTRSPVVRRLAESLGVDLATVTGTGAGGSVLRADVVAVAQAAQSVQTAQSAQTTQAARDARPQRRHVKASPLARKRAVELGVALEGVTGTGREGAVTRADVELAGAASREAGQTSVALGEGRVVEQIAPTRRTAVEQQASMRRSIAALMSRSKREIPHYYISTTIDFSASAAWLQQENLSRTPERRLLPAALLLKAVALAVKAVPEMNGFFVDDAFQQSPKVHLGVAIALRQGGLIAPAIHDADLLGLDEVMSALKDLVNRARSGKLKSSEMADPTITVTNLGDQGVESVFGVIYPPQVALVGFGKISERPWAVAGMIGVRPLVIATLAADHRVSDGHRGSRFLAAIDRYLQQPEGL